MKGLGGGWGESESLVFVGVFKVDGLGRERGRGYDNFFFLNGSTPIPEMDTFLLCILLFQLIFPSVPVRV